MHQVLRHTHTSSHCRVLKQGLGMVLKQRERRRGVLSEFGGVLSVEAPELQVGTAGGGWGLWGPLESHPAQLCCDAMVL